MVKYKFILVIIGIISIAYSAQAQNPLSLYYLENVPQTVTINPAMVPRAKSFFGVPFLSSVYSGVNTDLLGSDMVQSNNGSMLTLTQAGFDYGPLYKRIGDAANLSVYQTVAPFVFGFSGKRGYFVFTLSEKANASLAVPKDIFSILDKGVPDGSEFDFSPFAVNANYYRELSFGYSYKFMSKLRVGIHAKALQGLGAIKTDIKTFDLNTSKDLWHMKADGTVYMSAPIEVYSDENGIPDSIGGFKTDTKSLIDKGILNFSNPGFGIDIGAVYELNDFWTFSASVNDLGFIHWSSDLNSFSANGEFDFVGLEVDNESLDDISTAVDDLMDTLKNTINLTHGHEGFTTSLGPEVYLGAKYNVNHYLGFGALSRTVFNKNDFHQEFNASVNVNLYHVLSTTVNYTVASNGANTLGFGLALRGGPLQFYLASDYLPYAYKDYTLEFTSENADGSTGVEEYTVPGPNKIDNFNLMFGLNIIIGANGWRDEPMINAYSGF